MTGMMIETNKRIAEGTRLFCQFYLPNATRVQASGRIVRIIQHTSGEEGYQYGLMFTDLDPNTKQQLADFVEGRSHRSGPDHS